LRKIFAEGVIKELAAGVTSVSISPPDGVGYCECEKCRAQDDPSSIEPSSGKISVTDRYVDFFNEVARRVAEKYPKAKLNFYCYADYTQAPTRGMKLEKNLVAWLAPLRYCRLHAIGNPICPSRVQLAEMVDGWGKAASNAAIAYRTYNYNLAECLVPFSLMAVWKHDMPYLAAHGAEGVNLETLASWQIYGPHIYLSLKLAYEPKGNADAIMEDYFAKFYGPASREMKEYWMGVDGAFVNLHAHSGSFYPLHRVYTEEFLAKCVGLLDKAAELTKGDAKYAARVAMSREGFGNAAGYIRLREAMNGGKVAEAREEYSKLAARTEAQQRAGYGNKYTTDYLKRFIGGEVEAAAVAGRGQNRVVMVLPDRWRMQYDPENVGVEKGLAAQGFDDSSWRSVSTFGDTLDAQGLEDRKTVLWYRCVVDVPKLTGKPALFFVEVDGIATVFINGKEAGGSSKKRVAFEVDGSALHEGKNTIAVRVDHSAISELFLGGITRPVYLIEKGP
jgi:hypothetical protein